MPVEVQTPGGDISRLLESFPGLKIVRVDGTDFVASYAAYGEAVAYARQRRGPALVHAKVIRPYSHSLSDDERLYKSAAERRAEAERDPIKKLHRVPRRCRRDRRRTTSPRSRRRSSRRSRRPPSARWRRRSPRATRPRCSSSRPTSTRRSDRFATEPLTEGKPDTMVAAINRTLKDEMARNPPIVVFGEDVADCSREEHLAEVPGKGGVFKVTHGLQRAFGSDRVFNSPLAEANIVGRAVGMAMRGLKPVVEIQFFDYIWPAMMQIRDEMTMMRYRSNNTWSCPVVVRVPIGGYLRGGAPYHSQSGESIFAHCPGHPRRVPVERGGRGRPAADRHPLRRPGAVPRAQAPVPPDLQQGRVPGPRLHDARSAGAVTRREGHDVTVVTWGALVQRTLLAAQQAEKDGISVRVIDLRTLVPFDWDTIAAGRPRDQPAGRRARGPAHVRLRRRDRRAHRRRALRAPRRARAAGGVARHARRLQPRSRRGDPAADGRRAEGDPARGALLTSEIAMPTRRAFLFAAGAGTLGRDVA